MNPLVLFYLFILFASVAIILYVFRKLKEIWRKKYSSDQVWFTAQDEDSSQPSVQSKPYTTRELRRGGKELINDLERMRRKNPDVTIHDGRMKITLDNAIKAMKKLTKWGRKQIASWLDAKRWIADQMNKGGQ